MPVWYTHQLLCAIKSGTYPSDMECVLMGKLRLKARGFTQLGEIHRRHAFVAPHQPRLDW